MKRTSKSIGADITQPMISHPFKDAPNTKCSGTPASIDNMTTEKGFAKFIPSDLKCYHSKSNNTSIRCWSRSFAKNDVMYTNEIKFGMGSISSRCGNCMEKLRTFSFYGLTPNCLLRLLGVVKGENPVRKISSIFPLLGQLHEIFHTFALPLEAKTLILDS
jgi:hypothetical protein